MIIALLFAAAGVYLTAHAEGPWWFQAIGYFLAAMVAISGVVHSYRTRNTTPLRLDRAETAVLRKLRDDEGLNSVELIKLVRQRHPSAGLAEVKVAVEKI